MQKVFGGDRAQLDREVEASLGSSGQQDSTKTFGKTVRYPVGTVAWVRRGSARYFLIAFTRMSSSLPANVESSITDLQIALAAAWAAVRTSGQQEPVHVPILGLRLARLDLSRTLLIQLIVLSFIAGTRQGGPPRMTIWIRKEDAQMVDMPVLKEWLRGLCAA